MVWVFLFLLLALGIGYVWPLSTVSVQQTHIPHSFLFTSILSTLAIHGILSYVQEEDLEEATVASLENLLVEKEKNFTQQEWRDLVFDHCSINQFVDDVELDL
ncbi:hypothetical protein [Bacillus sp. 2205SS5-2]|uniref:hypothetical protein n=1 Tax=Bacillus sp. 2205SS5-2 TaxID=3109031 RepID=UPI003005629A